MTHINYYIEQFSDETMPCVPTLEGWAEWLAKAPDDEEVEGWRSEPVADGETFRAYVMEHLGEIEATRTKDDWTFDVEPPAGLSFFAQSYGRGMGWDVENSNDNMKDFLECQIDFGVEEGDTVLIAICRDLPDVLIRFDRAPEPKCSIVEAVH